MDASNRKERAAREASDWFARLQAGAMERAEREQFVQWLRESHLHIAEMLRVAQIHGSLERFQGWSRLSTGPATDADNLLQFPPSTERGSQIPEDPQPAPRALGSPRRRGTGHVPMFFAFAAMVLLVVGTLTLLPRIGGRVIETERGERREVVLADGSMLQIDPQTRLRVKYGDTVRRVFLERGRALFHVSKNSNRPFMVQADETTVRAVGTEFGVEQRDQQVIVTVSEGKVAVFPTSSRAPVSADVPLASETSTEESNTATASGRGEPTPRRKRKAKGPELFLIANQQLTVAANGSAESVQEVNSARALAWAEGRLIFQNDEVSQVVAEFNRYSHVQLTVKDPVLAKKPVSGVFNAAEPEAFIAFLNSVTPLEIVRDGDRSISIGAARHP